MKRTFETTAEQDAAIAWRVAQLKITEAELIDRFVSGGLVGVVAAYKDAEAASIYDAAKNATPEQRAEAKAALGLNG